MTRAMEETRENSSCRWWKATTESVRSSWCGGSGARSPEPGQVQVYVGEREEGRAERRRGVCQFSANEGTAVTCGDYLCAVRASDTVRYEL